MSASYDPKDELSAYQALKVQELAISGVDSEMYSLGSPAIIVNVALGRAENFGVLGASAVTNTGSSVITGDLGSFPTDAISGFPPGTVIGTIHHADSAAANAQIDAMAAYTLLAAHSYTSITAALDGQTLTPGYYTESSGTFNLAASGNGTLILDGQGDINSLFVFKAASTLVTGAGGIPTISLINGASAKNVFWVIGSSATINSGSAGTFQGNILAQASITDTLGGIVNGRLVALTGAVTLSAATVLNRTSSSAGGNLVIHIGEFVEQVYLADCKIDSSNAFVEFPQSSISLLDSDTGLPGGNQNDIKISGLGSLADNDCLLLDYRTKH